MLCQTSGSFTGPFTRYSSPVVNVENLYRGRFRRIVTIGSPQNGSLILYYLDQMPTSINPIDKLLSEIPDYAAPAVEKFDPDRWQIQYINSSFPVDSRIRFYCIVSTINGGQY